MGDEQIADRYGSRVPFTGSKGGVLGPEGAHQVGCVPRVSAYLQVMSVIDTNEQMVAGGEDDRAMWEVFRRGGGVQ